MPNRLTNENKTLASSNVDVLSSISVDERGRLTYNGIPVGSYDLDPNGNIDFTNFVLWSSIDKDNDGVVDYSNTAYAIKGVDYSSDEISNSIKSSHTHNNQDIINDFKVTEGVLYYKDKPILTGYEDTDILKKKEYTNPDGQISYSSESGSIEGFKDAPNQTFYGKNSDGVIGFHPINANLNLMIEQYKIKCDLNKTRVIDLPFGINNNNIIIQCYERVDKTDNSSRNIYEMLEMYSDAYNYNPYKFSIREYGEVCKEHYCDSTLSNYGYYESNDVDLNEFVKFSKLATDMGSIDSGLVKSVPVLYGNTSEPGIIVSASSQFDGTYAPWKAFCGVTTNAIHVWLGSPNSLVVPQWLKVEFNTPIKATAFTYSTRPGFTTDSPREYYIEGSNDNLSWDILFTEINGIATDSKTYTHRLTYTGTYKYYRMRIIKSYGSTVAVGGFNLLVPKGMTPLVPNLTSDNSSPGIVVKASSIYNSSYYAWKAFNGSNIDANDCWHSEKANNVPEWLQVSFSKPTSVSGFTYSLRNYTIIQAPATYKIQGSNNEVDWVDLYEGRTDKISPGVRYEHNLIKSYSYLHYRFLALASGETHIAIGMFNLLGKSGHFMIKTNEGYFIPTKEYYDTAKDMFQPLYDASNEQIDILYGSGDLENILESFDVNGIKINPKDYFRKFKIVSSIPTTFVKAIGLKSFQETVSLKNGKNLSSASEIYSLTPIVEIDKGCDIKALISINGSPWSKYNLETRTFDPVDENLIMEHGMTIDDITKIIFIGHEIKKVNLLFSFKVNNIEDNCKLHHIIVKQKSKERFKKISEQDYDVDIYVDEIRFTPKIEKEEFIINVMM